MNMNISDCRRLGGFSLVEMAIVLTIVGILMASLLPTVTSQIEQQRRSETRKQLAEIQQALMGFAIMNVRLPCPILPGTPQADPANAAYGQEPASCSVNAIAEGYLPWKTLGVSEIDAWGTKRTSNSNPWNGYWRYRTDRNFSNTASPITLIPVATGFSTDNLSIVDNSGASLTSGTERPIAIVFSTGPDLIGNRQNANIGEPSPSFEQTNGIYQSDVPSTNFDDILIWLSRPQLFNRMVAAGKLP